MGIWHIHTAFKLLFAEHWDPDPLEGRDEPAALRQEETEATKNLFPLLTCKVRKTTLSCLLEGKSIILPSALFKLLFSGMGLFLITWEQQLG